MNPDVSIVSVEVPGPHCCGTVELSVAPKLAFELMAAHVRNGNCDEVTSMFLNKISGKWELKKVVHHFPATIAYWSDGTKTVVKCDPRDTYSKEAGLAMCYMKKMLGSSRAFNDALKKWSS